MAGVPPLVRSREDLGGDPMRVRDRIWKFLLRRELYLPGRGQGVDGLLPRLAVGVALRGPRLGGLFRRLSARPRRSAGPPRRARPGAGRTRRGLSLVGDGRAAAVPAPGRHPHRRRSPRRGLGLRPRPRPPGARRPPRAGAFPSQVRAAAAKARHQGRLRSCPAAAGRGGPPPHSATADLADAAQPPTGPAASGDRNGPAPPAPALRPPAATAYRARQTRAESSPSPRPPNRPASPRERT